MKATISLVVLVGLVLVGTVNVSIGLSGSHPFLTQWGGTGPSSGSFYNPQNLAIDSHGNVYVTDLGNKRVQKFDNDGTFLNAWGRGGTGAGEFNSPRGIATYENFVYVVDSQLNRIQKFDTNGNFVTQWGSYGNEQGQFLLPTAITINKNGTILVVDTGNKRIQQFSSEGEFLREFGESGSGNNQFISPIGITTDDDNNIYVSDPGSNRIKKFNSMGNFITSFGPNIAGFSLRPQGLQIDPEGNIYVADSGNNRILRLDSNGITLTAFGSMGIQAGQFKIPKDVALDQNGNLFVVDSNGHRIQKFGTPTIIDIQTTITEPTTTPILGDFTKPVIITPNDLIIEATGPLTPVSVGQAFATDLSGIQSITTNAPSVLPLGITTIIWTAIDGSGNMAIATQTVTVTDTVPPVISPLQDIIIEASNPTQNLVELEPPTVIDAVGVMSITSDSPDVFPIGETLVTWTASDIMGNTASTTQKIIVLDTSKPTLYVPENIVVEATSFDQNEIYLGEASVIDNGEIISVINDAPEFFGVGNTTITWVTFDSSGNTASSTQLVSVVDTTPPEITAPDNIVFEATSTTNNLVDVGSPTVIDIQQVTITNNAPAVFPIGETIVIWNATDASENFASVTQQITVIDSTPPSLTISENIIAEATGLIGNVINLGEIVVEDISEIASVINNATETFPLGNTTVTWNVIDKYGNVGFAEQIISIIDTIAPSIVPPTDIVIEAISQNQNFVDPGQPKVDDLVDIGSVTNDSPTSFSIGMTTVTWTVSDTSGNTSNATQVITVVDTTPPEIITPVNITMEAAGNETQVSIGDATVSDIVGVSSVTNDAPDVFPLGETIVTWTATDTHGNVATTTQIITIVDTTPPTITAPANVLVEAIDPSANTVEIGVADVTEIVGLASVDNNAPNLFPVGDTIVTWTAIDSVGNSASATQTVSVVDTTAPQIIAPDTIIIEATSENQNIIKLVEPLAEDYIGIVSITNDAPELFPVGDTIVTWTAIDSAGNSASATQTVSVVDTTAPKLYLPPTITAEATGPFGNVVEYGSATASDEVAVTSISNDAPSTFSLGETIVTWMATDSSGNSASAAQRIIFVDTTPPELVLPDHVIVDSTDMNTIVSIGQANSTDLTDPSPIITNDAPDMFSLGETIVTWTAIDTFGNSVNATQKIEVQACGKPISYYNLIEGSFDDDIIVGTNLPDLIFAYGGDDIIRGEKGNDCIFGGEGDDIIFGNEGNDNLSGGEGNDIIKGQAGSDIITSGTGMDIIDGGDDIDTCIDAENLDGDLVVKCEL
ncbi:MAG: HYR domain-containing protein [Thaumarchaeota archaeon]|nr:HYR domain-containing protein [Nitrososphaerota archaeon]